MPYTWDIFNFVPGPHGLRVPLEAPPFMRNILRTVFPLLTSITLLVPQVLAAPGAIDPERRERLLTIEVDLKPAPAYVLDAAHMRRLGDKRDALAALKAAAPSTPPPEVDLLLGVLSVEVEDYEGALPALVRARTALPILGDTIDLYLGLALAGADEAAQGSHILQSIPNSSPHFHKARRIAAELDLTRGAEAQALLTLGALAGDEPWESLDPGLLLLMGQALEAVGGDGKEDLTAALKAYQLAAVRHPSHPDGKEAQLRMDRLAKARGLPIPPPSPEDQYAAARTFLRAHLNEEAAGRLQGLLKELDPQDPLRCDVALDLGRAHQKERQYTDSLPSLELAATDVCPPEEQVKAVYLIGRAHGRRGLNDNALTTYASLIQHFPDHSMADDAYLLSAVIHLERKDLKKAEDTLSAQLRRYPKGDMAAEAAWRLAWTLAQDARKPEAIAHLKDFIDANPGAPANDVLRARYWSAWWRYQLAQSQRGQDGAKDSALNDLTSIATDAPLHFYGVMAFSRLQSLAPDLAKGIARPPMLAPSAAPQAPISLDPSAESEGILKAITLVRSGLPDLGRLYLKDVMAAGGEADASLRAGLYLEVLGLNAFSVGIARSHIDEARYTKINQDTLPWFALGFPLAFQESVEKHSIAQGLDPLLLWGLIREESNFDAGVRSWAGAMGLTQLMWPTARDTARKEGIRVTRSALRQGETNIRLGARYLGDLLKRFDDYSGLAVPGYNAGPGAVNRWLKERGDEPFDEWVEQIPYDQTRDYVKRVLGSYQTYHYLYRVEAEPYIKMPLALP